MIVHAEALQLQSVAHDCKSQTGTPRQPEFGVLTRREKGYVQIGTHPWQSDETTVPPGGPGEATRLGLKDWEGRPCSMMVHGVGNIARETPER